jgi:hypothetical protein
MKTTRLLCAGLLAATAVGFVGCSHLASSRARTAGSQAQRPVTFALSVTVKDGLQPSPEQWAAIQARISAELLAAGHVLVTDLSIADRIIRVDFRPNPSDPNSSGNAVIVSVRDNPLRQIALVSPPAVSPVRGTPYPTSFGFGQSSFVNSYYSLSNPYGSFGSSYYGYGHSYYDGYTYSSPGMSPSTPATPAPVTPPTTPVTPVVPPRHGPGRHHPGLPPGERPVCPPLLAVATPVAPAASRIAYPSDRPPRAFIAAARSSDTDSGRGYSSGGRSFYRGDSSTSYRSGSGDYASSDRSGSSSRYDRYTSQGSADNAAASARRAESRQVSDRSYSRDSSSGRDDSYRSKSDYSSSSYSSNSSYSSSGSSYSSSSSFSSSSSGGSSYSAPASSSSSSGTGGSSGTHESTSNTQQH